MAKSSYVFTLPEVSLDKDDTFSRDLLRQFDKKRSRLHFELGLLSEEPSPESSTIEEQEQEQEQPSEIGEQTSSIREIHEEQNRSSASDLLRRSSAFLRSKFDSFKKANTSNSHLGSKRSIDSSLQQQQQQQQQQRLPTKLIMKTTIAIQSSSSQQQQQQQQVRTPFIPPTITQYPPKPLVYSPVEPIYDQAQQSQHTTKQLFHRLSMPLIKAYHHSEPHPNRPTRRRSEPDNHNKYKKK